MCSKAHLGTLAAAIFSAGEMAGTIILSILADNIGRKKIIFFGLFISSVTGMLYSIPVAVWYTCIWRFTNGFCGGR